MRDILMGLNGKFNDEITENGKYLNGKYNYRIMDNGK